MKISAKRKGSNVWKVQQGVGEILIWKRGRIVLVLKFFNNVKEPIINIEMENKSHGGRVRKASSCSSPALAADLVIRRPLGKEFVSSVVCWDQPFC